MEAEYGVIMRSYKGYLTYFETDNKELAVSKYFQCKQWNKLNSDAKEKNWGNIQECIVFTDGELDMDEKKLKLNANGKVLYHLHEPNGIYKEEFNYG